MRLGSKINDLGIHEMNSHGVGSLSLTAEELIFFFSMGNRPMNLGASLLGVSLILMSWVESDTCSSVTSLIVQSWRAMFVCKPLILVCGV